MTVLALAVLALAQDDAAAAEDAVKQFKTKMKSASVLERCEAVAELGKTPHEKTLAVLTPFLTSDLGQVRASAARALGGFADHKKAAIPALQRALAPNEKDPGALAAVLSALGSLGDGSALPSVLAYLDHREDSAARAATSAAGAIGTAVAIQPLIDQLRKLEKQEKSGSGGKVLAPNPNPSGATVMAAPDERIKRRVELLLPETRKALSTASGEQLQSADEWQAWWLRARATFNKKP
jgi:HEAT repeat protein